MIGKRLRKLRKERDLLQKELADKLNLSQQTISLYESNDREPDSKITKRIANFFDVSIDYLYQNTDERSPADKIKQAISDDEELLDFWNELKDREDLQLMFKQTKNLNPDTIQQIISIIKTFEKEQDDANGG